MGARIVDHYRDCGSLDRYIVIDALGWVVIEGVELDERHALDAAHRVEGQRFYTEAEARAEFDRRNDPPTTFGADP